MPTVRETVETEVEVRLEFQMWCGICGAGICHNTEYVDGSDNHFNTYCDSCNEEKENLETERDELKESCESMKEENEELEEKIEELEEKIKELELESKLE